MARGPDMTALVKIAIRPAEPEFMIVPRKWWKRLFHQPFRSHDRLDFPDAVERNKQVWLIGAVYHVTPQCERALRQQLDRIKNGT